MKQLINDYYFLCSLLDDNIEMLASFLKYKGLTKHRKSMLIIFFENLRLKNVEKEIDLAMDCKINEFNEYKVIYTNEQLRVKAKSHLLYQSNIWDFI